MIFASDNTEPEIAAVSDGRMRASNSLPAVFVRMPEVQANKLELFECQPGHLAWCHWLWPAEGCGRATGCGSKCFVDRAPPFSDGCRHSQKVPQHARLAEKLE